MRHLSEEEVLAALRALVSTSASLLVLIESLPDGHEAKEYARTAQRSLMKILRTL